MKSDGESYSDVAAKVWERLATTGDTDADEDADFLEYVEGLHAKHKSSKSN